MKGPYQRLKYDLRRLWECPACHKRERTSGAVSFRHCACQNGKADGSPVVMKLIADGAQRTTVAPPARLLTPDAEPAQESSSPSSAESLPAPPAMTEAPVDAPQAPSAQE